MPRPCQHNACFLSLPNFIWPLYFVYHDYHLTLILIFFVPLLSTFSAHLFPGPLTAGVLLLIILVHLIVLSLMQDYLWLLTDYHGQNSPTPDMSSKAAGADAKERGAHTPVETDEPDKNDNDVTAEAEEEENDLEIEEDKE